MMNSSTAAGADNVYRKAAVAFTLLIVSPFILSMLNMTFAGMWKIHFFPAAIILAALVFGAAGGLVAGVAGSLYSAVLLGNPYLIAGNALFGFMTGVFYRKTNNIILSVLLAFLCELPWLVITDYYFMNLSAQFIMRLTVVLFLADILWAVLVRLFNNPLRRCLC